jgi:hypothetical protein
MTGRITRLIDTQQVGAIAGEDGQEYVFKGGALLGASFSNLSLGAVVIFEPSTGSSGAPRAVSVRPVNK